jgi:hypothetical protein
MQSIFADVRPFMGPSKTTNAGRSPSILHPTFRLIQPPASSKDNRH